MQQLFPDKKIIWVESLYSLDLLFLIPRVFFTDCIIYYDEHQISKLCIRLINLLKRIKLCSNYYPAKLSFDIKDIVHMKNLEFVLTNFAINIFQIKHKILKRWLRRILAFIYYRKLPL